MKIQIKIQKKKQLHKICRYAGGIICGNVHYNVPKLLSIRSRLF